MPFATPREVAPMSIGVDPVTTSTLAVGSGDTAMGANLCLC